VVSESGAMRGIDASLRSLRRLADVCAWGVLVPAGVFAAVGVFADLGWPLDLFPHFAIQCAALQMPAILYFALRRRFLPAALALALLLIIAAPVARYHWATPATAAPPALRVMTLNVDSANERADLVRQAILTEAPDVVFLAEATTRWAAALAGLRAAYPHGLGETTGSKFSVLLLSRLPLHDAQVHRVDGAFPFVSARLCSPPEGRCLTIVGIRPPAPTTGARAAARRAVFDAAIALRARARGGPFVLLGDFNATPWSPAFRRLVRAAGMRDSALGFGLRPTFGSRSWLFGQLIDHVLVDPGTTVVSRRVGPDVGSDHYPVIADLSF
jgi:endonuclease/exonuclease/phosphatase (EEP) superfamily protein YafD